jgi:hypothetical protein
MNVYPSSLLPAVTLLARRLLRMCRRRADLLLCIATCPRWKTFDAAPETVQPLLQLFESEIVLLSESVEVLLKLINAFPQLADLMWLGISSPVRTSAYRSGGVSGQ